MAFRALVDATKTYQTARIGTVLDISGTQHNYRVVKVSWLSSEDQGTTKTKWPSSDQNVNL